MANEMPVDDAESPTAATTNNLCALGPRAYVITGALVMFLRQHFATRDSIADPALRDLVYKLDNGDPDWVNPDPASIVIESSSRWKPEVAGSRPQIVVRRNQYDTKTVGINNELQGGFNRDGDQHHAAMVEGTHTVFCVATEADEAERLGYEVYTELLQFSSVIREWLDLHRFMVHTLGELVTLEEAPQSYAAPITVGCGFFETWRVIMHAPKLKRISLDAVVCNSI